MLCDRGFMKFLFVLLLIFGGSILQGESLTAPQLEFFEKKIRPVLDKNCYKCHSTKSKKVKGKLLLDSKAGWMRGGDTGQVIIPGDAKNSLLVKMINHLPDYESMPTKSKLKPQEIKDIEAWIKMGAPDPRIQKIPSKENMGKFNLEERKKWWAFQKGVVSAPPQVKNKDWLSNDIDKFILAKLEAKNWQPSAKADKRTLIRRLTFDLTGLPPLEKDINNFLNDKSPKAYEKVVDRLLASPHFGEKWARHWMDNMRFAETKAFEADYTMPHVYQYRDYLIRAYNSDVPYDQFVLESLAGDLLEKPRLNKKNGNNESLAGSGFMYLTDGQHGPPDIHGDEARIFDGMINVTGKAFTGLTVACAKCHDHKFDAITTKDYYSLYGIISSSRFHNANIAAVNKQKSMRLKLRAAKDDLFKEYITGLKKYTQKIPAYVDILRSEIISKKSNSVIDKMLQSKGLNKAQYVNWKKAVTNKKINQKVPGFRMMASFISAKDVKTVLHISKSNVNPPMKKVPFYGLSEKSNGEMIPSGIGFGSKPVKGGEIVISTKGDKFIQNILGPNPSAGFLSGRYSGAIRTPDFMLDGSPVSIYVKGKNAVVNLIVRHYELVGKGPTTNRLRVVVKSDQWQKVSFRTNLWKNEKAYIEVVQHGASLDVARNGQYSYKLDESAYVSTKGLTDFNEMNSWKGLKADSLKGIGVGMGRHINNLLNLWSSGSLNNDQVDLLYSMIGNGLLPSSSQLTASLKRKVEAYRKLAQEVPKPIYVRSLVDGTPADEPVYIRGNHKSLSKEKNSRHFLDGINGKAFNTKGSGRLEWAKAVIDKENPLTARVMVNRLWYHIFGRGIVYSTNNFGKLGRKPSHPELLEFLAQNFVKEGWSIKKSLRQMVLSSTYQMSSVPLAGVDKADPENELLQHMSVRRMTAEMIRDNILATTGGFKAQLFGPSVAANVNGLPSSRARPKRNGPVDGAGRRSIYQELRRNFLPPFLMAFDMPNGTEPIGRRNVTNVPAQSLALMNDEFMQLQSTRWGKSIASVKGSIKDKVSQLHVKAFGRPVQEQEIKWALQIFKELSSVYKLKPDSPEMWKEFCHILLNRKEFIYIF
jgi:hypothetical protein